MADTDKGELSAANEWKESQALLSDSKAKTGMIAPGQEGFEGLIFLVPSYTPP